MKLLLGTSLSASAMIVFILILHACGRRRLPAQTLMTLWMLALLRLFVPLVIPESVGLLRSQRLLPVSIALDRILPQIPAQDVETLALPMMAAAPETFRLSPAHCLALAWGLGALVCAARFFAPHVRWRLEYRSALPATHAFVLRWQQRHPLRRRYAVCVSDRIDTPLTVGTLRPLILLPKSMDFDDERTLDYALTHEYYHIRRLDALRKLLLTLALCLHWFNPLVWWMAARMNRDMERACDAAVVASYGADVRKSYARMLLSMEARRARIAPFGIALGKNAIEERICSIMSYNKTPHMLLMTLLTICLCMATAFASSPKADPILTSSGSASPTGAFTELAQEPQAGLDQRSVDIKLLHFFNDIKPAYPSGTVVTVYDPSGKSSWALKFMSMGRHADCVPLTEEDAAFLNAAFGNVTTWTPKAVWVEFPDGAWSMATMHNTPHLDGNNSSGSSLCLHFLRDLDECAQNNPLYGMQHQAALRAAWEALTGETVH